MRQEFSKPTKRAIWERSGGHCEYDGPGNCGHAKIIGAVIYDHKNADYVSKDNSVENGQAICSRCNRIKTDTIDRPAIDKTRRILEKRAGLRTTRPMDGSRRSRYRKRMDGTVERR
jgi:5-methylcytosine-specific restriction endonuclease McrA